MVERSSAPRAARQGSGSRASRDCADGQLVPALVVRDGPRRAASSQSQRSACRSASAPRAIDARARCFSIGARGRVALGGADGQAVQQQVAGARGLADARRGRRRGRPRQPRHARRRARGGRRRRAAASASRYVSRASVGVERLEPFGGVEQQRRSVAAARDGERELGTQQVGAGAVELVERTGLRQRQQLRAASNAPAAELRLRGRERARRPVRGVGRELGGTLEERGGRGQPAASLGPAGRALELGGDVLVRRPSVARARCQARRSGSASPSVASARARCTRRRSAAAAAR